MDKLVTYVKGDLIIIQRSTYIEDGWYVEVDGDMITLFEIPLGGGVEEVVCCCSTLLEAIKIGEELT